MLRHIAWFNEASITPLPNGELTSADLTVCRRCLTPARAIEENGTGCSIFGNLHDADPAHVAQHLQKLNCDIVVIGKLSGGALIKLARAAKHMGCYVVADFGAAPPPVTELGKLADIADQMVVATSELAQGLKQQISADILVIPDCGTVSAQDVAQLWMDGFNKLKQKPPVCANTNIPAA